MGFETLLMLTHPVTMAHSSIPPETRLKMGIADGLVRMSVGIESRLDLAEDIRQALDNTKGT